MQLPNYLKPYLQAAESYLKKGLVKDIEFSGGTYQVRVVDAETKEDAWSFMQLDNRGQIKDCFCSCKEDEEFSPCVHICAAYLRIYNNNTSPLHQRFERSLWNLLCRQFADDLGYDPSLLKSLGKGRYICRAKSKKVAFEIHAKTAGSLAYLKELLLHRNKQTEETSLKFSNLPQEELMLWREGRPSAQLKYELSFWNDFAKWLMLLQDNREKYEIEFGYSSKDIPNEIRVFFPEVSMKFMLSEAVLLNIIPALSTVKSPLKVHNDPQEEIKKITYEKKDGCLVIEPKSSIYGSQDKHDRHKKEDAGHVLDGWIFVPGDGFYARDQHGLLASQQLTGLQISQALNEHFHVIKSLLQGTPLHQDAVQACYSISFDPEWNLHITCYIHTPGDLSCLDSRYFGDWVYLAGEGFYRLEGARFPGIETVVPQSDVADFVSKNRTWLNTQEGFHTHLASVEAQLAYTLSSDNRLTFTRKLAIKEESGESKDFGPWVYISGEGFYAKVSSQVGLPLRPGIVLSADQIPLFIRANKDELQLVPGFFSEKCPVIKSGLNIIVNDDGQVVVSPHYDLLPDYVDKPLRFLEDFVYVEGEGFHELPADSRLPERYRNPHQIEQENLDLFLTYELDTLRPFAVTIDPRLIPPKDLKLYALGISKDEQTGMEYLLKLKYQAKAGSIFVSSLWSAIKSKQRFVFSDAGLIDLDDQKFKWLRWLKKGQVDRRSHTIRLSTLELIRLNALQDIEIPRGKSQDSAHSHEILDELIEFKTPDPPNLAGLNSHLRPYQVVGVNWLWFLYRHGLSGLLCDDMGLGKTHQAMALLAAIRNFYKAKGDGRNVHFLVVCPTSVIYHWQEKLALFLPEIRICTFYGSNRSLEDFHGQYDLLLTSYGIWRIENELLSKVPFEVAIFDEIQIAKNQSSRVYATLIAAQAKMRLGLTGTPIENNLRELKALFDIVLPSYMPHENEYREFFIKPIEKEGNQERKQALSRLIKPFVLRRKKEDVLTDLPDKIEEIAHCPLLPGQQLLYNDVLRKSRQRLLKELEDENNAVPYVHIFAILSSLKQICDHPAVFLKSPEAYKDYPSGKWNLFVELLSEARESQQKVVIYSQYLAMLDIIEAYLEELGIGYASIRGATTNRGEQLNRFNKDPSCEVFVASLQAAGLGVDLTAASVVIHYDRWWNAARENQATDRVHRIGQTRGVQVFKMVTKGTFEERIDELITKKGQLMEDVVGVDDHRFVKQFTRQELIDLLNETGEQDIQDLDTGLPG